MKSERDALIGDWVMVVDAPLGLGIPLISYGDRETLRASADYLFTLPCVMSIAVVPREEFERVHPS